MPRIPHIALLSILLVVSGCTAISDFERFHLRDGAPSADTGTTDAGTSDANVTDSGPRDSGPEDASMIDGGTCTDPVPELCNGLDDDCDDMIDETFDLQNDPSNCGECDAVCEPVTAALPNCQEGACRPVCDDGFGDCDGRYETGCEADLTLAEYCGSCDNTCEEGWLCVDSECVEACTGDTIGCGGVCVDPETSVEHCSDCDTPCPGAANASPICEGARCDIVCDEGWGDCNGEDGCESLLETTANCRSCGNDCEDPLPPNSIAMCGEGGCEYVCEAGWDDCDGSFLRNGCESDLSLPGSCGSCATICSGGTPLCDADMGCVSGCSAPTPTLCGESCVDTTTNEQHCGGCDRPCPTRAHATPTCDGSTCDFECLPGWEDCDGIASNGCEANLLSTNTCGDCSTACTVTNGTGACTATGCIIASCDGGYGDCDGDAFNCDPLVTAWIDSDGDLYGNPTISFTGCPALVPSGYVSDDGEPDCLDSDDQIHPGATERCNYINDDCDGELDEGFMVGEPCSCEPGARQGQILCDSDTSSSCSYPSEICNGADDDCDGGRDETFTCPAGGSRNCSATVGMCSFAGTQDCTSSCTWDACVPPAETCNDADDDCDGLVDDGLYQNLTALQIHEEERFGTVLGQPDIAFDEESGHFGVLFIAEDAAGSPQVFLAILEPELEAVVGIDQLTDTANRKDSPRIVAIEGRFLVFFVNYGDDHVMWASVASGDTAEWREITETIDRSTVFDVSRNPFNVNVLYSDGEFLRKAVFDASDKLDDRAFGMREQGDGSVIEDVGIAFFGGFNHVILAENGGAAGSAITYRRMGTSGAQIAESGNILPTGYGFFDHDPRSTWLTFMDAPGSLHTEDRLAVAFYARTLSTTSWYALLDGTGAILNRTQISGTGIRISMSSSPSQRTFAIGRGSSLIMRTWPENIVPPTVPLAAGSYQSMIADSGPFRYVHASRLGSDTIAVTGVGCR